jgi:hypothetical protein
VPPAIGVLVLAVLTIARSADGVTASTSVTVQVGLTQPVAVLVLATVAGAVIDAVFVICVCALAICGKATQSITPNTSAKTLEALKIDNRKKVTRLRTLDSTNEATPLNRQHTNSNQLV